MNLAIVECQSENVKISWENVVPWLVAVNNYCDQSWTHSEAITHSCHVWWGLPDHWHGHVREKVWCTMKVD